MKTKSQNKGFTLIEVLVVFSIITLVSSILTSALSVASAKGRDAQKVATARQVSNALSAFNLDKGTEPKNYINTDGTYNSAGDGNAIAIEDMTNKENPTTPSGMAYNASMKELVDGGYIPSIPHSPGGQPYAYYNYGKDSTAGAMFGTTLEVTQPTSTGLPGSCRPIPATSGYNPGADFDNSGIIDIADFDVWFNHVGLTNATHAQGDANGDGTVDIADFDLWFNSVGSSINDPGYHNFCSKNYSTDYCVCVTY